MTLLSYLCKIKLEKWYLPLNFNAYRILEWHLCGLLWNFPECLVLKNKTISWIFWIVSRHNFSLLKTWNMYQIRKLCKFQLKNWIDFFLYFNTLFNLVLNMVNINIFDIFDIFDMVYNTHWNFQHVLKFSTCFQHRFQHALQISTCAEMFNMLFQHAFNIVFNMHYRFQHAL